MSCPNRVQAEQLWQEGINYRWQKYGCFEHENLYKDHTRRVAESAEIIAAKTAYLNSEKAYVLGLLHDIGKRIPERLEDRFHGQEGYELMMSLGYLDVARICLTHSFHCQPILNSDTNYPAHWLDWVRSQLEGYIYDDYDRLIALCDMMTDNFSYVKIQDRVSSICTRYRMNQEQSQKLASRVFPLKDYFEEKCQCDIYELVIKNSKLSS